MSSVEVASFTFNDNNLEYKEILSLIIITIFCLIIGITSQFHAKFRQKNDFFEFGRILLIMFNLLDITSDILLLINIILIYIYNKNEILIVIIMICCICFILIPIILSLITLYKDDINTNNEEISLWINKRKLRFYISSIIFGNSFCALNIFNSNLYSLKWFSSMGLTKIKMIQFQRKRFYSINLFQNIPQIIIQCITIYIIGNKISNNYKILIFLSIIFSIISILITIGIIYKSNKFIKNIKFYICIQFTITSQQIVNNRKRLKNNIHSIRDSLYKIFNDNNNNINIIECTKPLLAPNGFKLKFNVGINIDNHDIVLNIRNKLIQSHNCGYLNKIICKCWNLSIVEITNIIIEKRNMAIASLQEIQLSNHLNHNYHNHDKTYIQTIQSTTITMTPTATITTTQNTQHQYQQSQQSDQGGIERTGKQITKPFQISVTAPKQEENDDDHDDDHDDEHHSDDSTKL